MNRAWLLITRSPGFGCAEAQPPVTRVQPGVARNTSVLDGEGCPRRTVIDTPHAGSSTFGNESGSVDPISGDVQGELVVSRRCAVHVANAGGATTPAPKSRFDRGAECFSSTAPVGLG